MRNRTDRVAWPGSAAAVLIAFILAGCDQRVGDQSRAEEIAEAAMAANPEDPGAGAKAALDALQHEFKVAIPPGSQQRAAAITFAGYFSKNVYSISAVCIENGVELAKYSATLAELNAAPFQAASRHVDVPAVIAAGAQSDLKLARQELSQTAALQKSNLNDVCRLIEGNSREVAMAATFAKAMPEIYAILMAAPSNSLERTRER